jgi:ketosteroid isomerase-like protein
MKTKISILLTIVLMFCVFTSFSQNGSKSGFDLAKAQIELESINQKISEYMVKGDAAGIASAYSSDGYLMPNKSSIVKGRENITKYWSDFIGSCKASGIEIGGLEITIKELSGDKNLLTDVGEFVFIKKNGDRFWKGKYIEVWKNENGKWMVHREMTNSNEPDSVN